MRLDYDGADDRVPTEEQQRTDYAMQKVCTCYSITMASVLLNSILLLNQEFLY